MISRTRERLIQGLARKKLIEHQAMKLPVRPKEFAEIKLGMLVEPFDPPVCDISGFLMRVDNVLVQRESDNRESELRESSVVSFG